MPTRARRPPRASRSQGAAADARRLDGLPHARSRRQPATVRGCPPPLGEVDRTPPRPSAQKRSHRFDWKKKSQACYSALLDVVVKWW